MITKNRYVELVVVAKEVCQLLEKKGVTREEFYIVRKTLDDMWINEHPPE